MPPKKASGGKADSKAKTKAAEDKTFGLKNKNKSAKVAKYVAQVKQAAANAGNPKTLKAAEEARNSRIGKKEEEARKKAELAELFKPVQTQKVPFGKIKFRL